MNYRKWVLVASLVFAISIGVGILNPAGFSLPLEYIDGLKELSKILPPGSVMILLLIFIKNVTAMLISFIFSPFFGIVPLLTLISNGWLIGYVATGVIAEKSISYLLVGIMPHGIFEIPALVLAQAAALNFGVGTLLAIFKKSKDRPILTNFKRSARYLIIAIILLIPAALIETYLTPWLLNLLVT